MSKVCFEIDFRSRLRRPARVCSSKSRTAGCPGRCPVRWAIMTPPTIRLGWRPAVLLRMRRRPIARRPARHPESPGGGLAGARAAAVHPPRSAPRLPRLGVPRIVQWDTAFSPVDARSPKTGQPVRVGRFGAFEIGRAKTGQAATGTLSRRSTALMRAYLDGLGLRPLPSTPLFARGKGRRTGGTRSRKTSATCGG